MNKQLSVADLDGYCSEWTAWRILHDITSYLSITKATIISPQSIVLHDDGSYSIDTTIEINGIYLPPEKTCSDAGCIWSLAATIFRLIMGCDVMSGLGGLGQRPQSPIPYMRTSMPVLSKLISRCLSYRPDQRPSIGDVKKMAEEIVMQNEQQIRKGPRLKQTPPSSIYAGEKTSSSSLWPEAMIALSLTLLMLFWPCFLYGQQLNDPILTKLIHNVSKLRGNTDSDRTVAYGHLKDTLSQDQSWTRMDELIDTDHGECRPTDKNIRWFRINGLLNELEMQRSGQDDIVGNFLNGEDPRFNYALLEKSVKAGSSVCYPIKGREGAQIFVLIPYDNSYQDLSFKLLKDQQVLAEATRDTDGNFYLFYPKDPALNCIDIKPENVISLKIINHGQLPIAFVLINHNTRK